MLAKRILSAFVILIFGFSLIFSGGWVYTIGITLILTGATWEFIRMFRVGGFQPNFYLPIFGTVIITLTEHLTNPTITSFSYVLVIFSICIQIIFSYKRKEKSAAIDLVIELAALVFITFLGSYLIKIRFLPNGLLWIMVSIFPACINDIGAYVFGSLFGKHQLSSFLSPNKTIEGYICGVISAIFFGYVLGMIVNTYFPSISKMNVIIISGVISTLAPLGDLSKSIIKRQFKLENTSNIIPGHGGILDRIDSWLWAAPIAYYLILFFYL